MSTMPYHRKPNWPMALLTIATIVTVALLFWAVAGDAILETRGALDG